MKYIDSYMLLLYDNKDLKNLFRKICFIVICIIIMYVNLSLELSGREEFLMENLFEKDEIILTEDLITVEGLVEWANSFALGTAGYRAQLDPSDPFNSSVAFNAVKLAIIAEAKASVYDELYRHRQIENHVGGEVRPHTQEFIRFVSRIYAAHGHKVHLRKSIKTTPIWYSSFGVFYNEYTDGENFTASHSPNFKGGWKPMDEDGKQLIKEAKLIEDKVREIIRAGYVIKLGPNNSPLITEDFDVTEVYSEYLKTIVSKETLEFVEKAKNKGFVAYACAIGGSMGQTSKPVFNYLGISTGNEGAVKYIYDDEDSNYHGIGIVDGENYGVDPGKWQIYKNIGAQKLLKDVPYGSFVFIWDPDGDRYNIVTTAPATVKEEAQAAGLETDDYAEDRILVYFKPNQIYFMLTAFRIEELKSTGLLDKYDWTVMETYPTSRSIGEVAVKCGQKLVQVPVGFKYFGDMVENLEHQLHEKGGKSDVLVKTVTGEEINLGRNPRVIIMAEESGGAAMGGPDYIISKNGKKKSLAIKEKDGMQVATVILGLAAKLYLEGTSFAEFYTHLIEKYDITYRFYDRMDVTLYNENLPSEELKAAKAAGLLKRDRVVAFFKSLVGKSPFEAGELLNSKAGNFIFPKIVKIQWAGDGTLIDFEDFWWEVRASGTDAVLRYYIEGRDKQKLLEINNKFRELDI